LTLSLPSRRRIPSLPAPTVRRVSLIPVRSTPMQPFIRILNGPSLLAGALLAFLLASGPAGAQTPRRAPSRRHAVRRPTTHRPATPRRRWTARRRPGHPAATATPPAAPARDPDVISTGA